MLHQCTMPATTTITVMVMLLLKNSGYRLRPTHWQKQTQLQKKLEFMQMLKLKQKNRPE